MTNVAMVVRVGELKEKKEHMEVLIRKKNGWFWRGRQRLLRMKETKKEARKKAKTELGK